MTEAKVTFRIRRIQGNRSAIPEVSDILDSLAAKEDINYLTNAGSSAVIDLAEFEEKGNQP